MRIIPCTGKVLRKSLTRCCSKLLEIRTFVTSGQFPCVLESSKVSHTSRSIPESQTNPVTRGIRLGIPRFRCLWRRDWGGLIRDFGSALTHARSCSTIARPQIPVTEENFRVLEFDHA